MPGRPRFTLHLAKPDFKFAASHLTWFAHGGAEALHGHNYTVKVALCGERLGPDGLLVEARLVKDAVRRLCAALDERVLLPAASPRVEVAARGERVELRVAGREYVLPASDVVSLPVPNISIECLAQHLWSELAKVVAQLPIDALRVEVAESDGQSASCEATL